VTSSGSVPRSSTRTKRSITPHTSLLRSAAAAIRGCVRARLSAGWGPTLRSGLLCFSAVLNHSQTTMTTMPDVLLYCNKQCSHILYSYTLSCYGFGMKLALVAHPRCSDALPLPILPTSGPRHALLSASGTETSALWTTGTDARRIIEDMICAASPSNSSAGTDSARDQGRAYIAQPCATLMTCSQR